MIARPEQGAGLAAGGLQPGGGIKTNLDPERNESTEPAMNPRAKRNPFIGSFCAGADWRERQRNG
jgi:hypothetical protein